MDLGKFEKAMECIGILEQNELWQTTWCYFEAFGEHSDTMLNFIEVAYNLGVKNGLESLVDGKIDSRNQANESEILGDSCEDESL